jgi:exportin-1
MERPEDIHTVEGEDGEMVREEMRNTITIELYTVMKETLIYLANLSAQDTLQAMQERINELHGENVDFVTALNALSWSAGALSGALPPMEERTFVIIILRQLFEMNQKEKSLRGRTYLAENIMFVCSQFPTFLSDNWPFMKLVIDKLFEFMLHEIDDVREMAVHTYKTIATKCRCQFLVSHGNEPPIIDDHIQLLEGHVSGLKLSQIVEIYGAVAVLVAGNVEEGVVAMQTRTLMKQLNGRFAAVLEAVELQNVEWLRTVAFIMRCNAAVIQAVEGGFGLQMDVILSPMVNLFPQMAALASEIVESGPGFDRVTGFRLYCDFGSSVLSILTSFVNTSKSTTVLTKSIVPVLLQIIATFSEVHPEARVPGTLQFVTALMTRLGRHMSVYMVDLWVLCFLPSVEMVRDDFESFPVIRLEIANFVEALVRHCQDAFFEASLDDLEVLVGMMNHGAGTPDFDICKRYLEAFVSVINCVERANVAFKNEFYGRFYEAILCKAFEVLTDTVHKFAFTGELNLIRKLLSVQHPINDRDMLVELLLSPELCPRRPRPFYENFVELLRESVANHIRFRDVLRDFVIEVKEYAIDDADLFREEMAEQQQKRRDIDRRIPGLMRPADPGSFE